MSAAAAPEAGFAGSPADGSAARLVTLYVRPDSGALVE